MGLMLAILLIGIDVLYLYAIPVLQLGLYHWVQKKYCIFYGLYIVLFTTIYNHVTEDSISVLYYTITGILIFVFSFTQGKWLDKLVWAFFPLAFLYALKISVSALLIQGQQAGPPELLVFYSTLLVKPIQLGVLILLGKKKIKQKEMGHTILGPCIIGFALMVGLLTFRQLTEALGEEISQKALLHVSLVFFLVNLAYLGVFGVWQQRNKALFQQQQMKMDLMAKNYAELLANHEKFKRLQGHINESLQVMWGLAKLHKVPELERYLAQFAQINQAYQQFYFTGDDVLDVVLSLKGALAYEKQIQLQTEVSWPPDHPFEALDVGTMLANLLDNALEALERWEEREEPKVIKLFLEAKEHAFTIRLENPTPEEKRSPKEIAALLSPQCPGLGLKIVHGLVRKYQGSWEIIHQEHCFQVLLTLPLNNAPVRIGK